MGLLRHKRFDWTQENRTRVMHIVPETTEGVLPYEL